MLNAKQKDQYHDYLRKSILKDMNQEIIFDDQKQI